MLTHSLNCFKTLLSAHDAVIDTERHAKPLFQPSDDWVERLRISELQLAAPKHGWAEKLPPAGCNATLTEAEPRGSKPAVDVAKSHCAGPASERHLSLPVRKRPRLVSAAGAVCVQILQHRFYHLLPGLWLQDTYPCLQLCSGRPLAMHHLPSVSTHT